MDHTGLAQLVRSVDTVRDVAPRSAAQVPEISPAANLIASLSSLTMMALQAKSLWLFDHAASDNPIVQIGEDWDSPAPRDAIGPARMRALRRRPILSIDARELGAIAWDGPKCRAKALNQVDTLLHALGAALVLAREQETNADSVRRLWLLRELAKVAAEAPDYQQALSSFVKVIAGALDADCAQAWSIALDNEGRTTYETDYVSASDRAHDFCHAIKRRLNETNHRHYGSGMIHRHGFLAASVDELDVAPGTYLADVRDFGFQSLVSIPVARSDAILGFTLLFERRVQNSQALRQLMGDLTASLSELLQRKLSEDRLSLLISAVECSNDAIIISEADGLGSDIGVADAPAGRIIYVNRAFTELTGYGAAEAIGNSTLMLHGPQTGTEMLEGSIRARARRESVRGEVLFYKKDGTPHWVRFSGAPVLDGQGGCKYYVSTIRDIMEWRAAQDALLAREAALKRLALEQRTVLDGLPANIVLLDAGGAIRSVNRGWLEFAAANGFSGELGWEAYNYLDVCRRAAAVGSPGMVENWAAIEAVLSGDRDHCAFDYPCHSPSEQRWYRCFFVKLLDDQSGYVAMHIDVTTRKRALDQMASALKTAEEADRMKGEFLANMSHELRTPLNAICGFSEMMKDEILGPLGSEHYKNYASDIFDSGRHLLAVIGDVLDMAKVSAGAMVLSPQWIDPREPLRLAVKMGGAKIESAAIRIDESALASVPELYADGRRLAQIFLNLISNAVKFSAVGSPIDIILRTSHDQSFIVEVVDRGIGMDEMEIDVALQPFKQVQGHLARPYEGTGLGLPLAKRLSELNGAVFSIASQKGSGTCVTLAWPRERVRWL